MTYRPIIGILPDFRKGSENTYSVYDFYAVRKNYIDSIIAAGGIPLIFTYDYQAMDRYLEMIDGLLVIGGYMDISPSRYGEQKIHPKTDPNLERENYEFEIVSKALKLSNPRQLPILGICNGMQLIAVIKGAKLIQHIPDHPQFMNHEQRHIEGFSNHHKAYHQVSVVAQTKFHKIVQEELLETNSSHHQGIATVENTGLVVNAIAKDGMIEGIEDPNHEFCIGVEWHPEYKVAQADERLFAAFIDKARGFRNF